MSQSLGPVTRPSDRLSRERQWALWRDIPLSIIGWVAVIGVFFWLASHVAAALLILIVAALLAYALAPLVSFAQRALPRPLAIGLVYIMVFGALLLVLYVSLRSAIDQFSSLAQTIESIDPHVITETLLRLGLTQAQIDSLGNQIIGLVQNITASALPLVLSTAGIIVDVVVVAVISIYLMAGGPKVGNWLRTSMPEVQQPRVNYLVTTLEQVVGGYIRGQLLLATMIGLLVGIGLSIMQIPYAILLGLLAFLLEFIPYLGTLSSGVICVLVGFTQGVGTGIIVLIYFVAIHVLEGYVVGPRVVGHAVGLHPAVALVALIAGAEAFGGWGALFAAPVAGFAQALIITMWRNWRYVPGGDLLTPVEINDAGEAVIVNPDGEPVVIKVESPPSSVS